MHKSFTRRLVLAVVLGTLSGAIAHADTTPSPTPLSVTGGDPVPTSPASSQSFLLCFRRCCNITVRRIPSSPERETSNASDAY